MPAYFVRNSMSPTSRGWRNIGPPSPLRLAQYGGRFLTRGGATDLLEGGPEPKRVVILEFADAAAIKRWYDSPEYQKILPGRLNNRPAVPSSSRDLTAPQQRQRRATSLAEAAFAPPVRDPARSPRELRPLFEREKEAHRPRGHAAALASQPLTLSPQRRPATLATRISAGVSAGLRMSVSTRPVLYNNLGLISPTLVAAATRKRQRGAAAPAVPQCKAGGTGWSADEICQAGSAAGRDDRLDEPTALADLSAGVLFCWSPWVFSSYRRSSRGDSETC